MQKKKCLKFARLLLQTLLRLLEKGKVIEKSEAYVEKMRFMYIRQKGSET